MTATHWFVVWALAAGVVFSWCAVGDLDVTAVARWWARRRDPVRPLGWDAAMAELELPELPLDRYSDPALLAELEASTAELDRWTAWVKAEPCDTAAVEHLRSLLRRHDELRAEMGRRADRDLAAAARLIDREGPT